MIAEKMEKNVIQGLFSKIGTKSYHNKVLKKCEIGCEEWTLADGIEWNFEKYSYDFFKKEVVKTAYDEKSNGMRGTVVTIWKNDMGRVFIDNHTYSLLKEDKKLSLRMIEVYARYYDNFSGDSERAELSGISVDDANSLMMINRFLVSLGSGIRKPSDKDKANEMSTYLTTFLHENNISI